MTLTTYLIIGFIVAGMAVEVPKKDEDSINWGLFFFTVAIWPIALGGEIKDFTDRITKNKDTK